MNKAQQIVYEEVRALNGIPINEEIYNRVVDLIVSRCHKIVSNVSTTYLNDTLTMTKKLSFGKVITSGMGKAGLVAHHFALTLCSTGTPAVFLHPSEAQHGDLGVVQEMDVLIIFSNSGETRELVELVQLVDNLHKGYVMKILITGRENSVLASKVHHTIYTGDPPEVCPLGLTPTTSTTVMSVIGDILVVMLMERIGFTAEEYYKRHHGGYLGEKAKSMKENGK